MEFIGQIVSINDSRITVFVRDANFKGEVGDYVSVNRPFSVIVAVVIAIEYTEIKHLMLTIKPVGEICNERFSYGVFSLPKIFEEVYTFKDEWIPIVLGKKNNLKKNIILGSSMMFNNADVQIDIDAFFGGHSAIFGNSGSGKSNSLARIIQNVFSQDALATGAKFVVIDANGEYEKAFSSLRMKRVNVLSLAKKTDSAWIKIPVWRLTADDFAVLLNATEKNQMPVLQRAIDFARIFSYREGNNLSIRNHVLAATILGIINSSDNSLSKIDKLISIMTKFSTKDIHLDKIIISSLGLKQSFRVSIKNDNGQIKDVEGIQKWCEQFIMDDLSDLLVTNENVQYDLADFHRALELAVLYEGSVSSMRIQEYTSNLCSRLQSLRDGELGKIFVKTNYVDFKDYVNDLFGQHQVITIDVSSLDDYAGEVVTKVLGKMFLDYAQALPIKASVPINLVIEEAHRYIKQEENHGVLGYNIFERIAKEGRKYGLLLIISSQRPSELSETVVSQCSNFLIHRIQNPNDLRYLSRMLPYIDCMSLNRLTYLPVGLALAFGTALPMPMFVKISLANPQPDSLNANIVDKWF